MAIARDTSATFTGGAAAASQTIAYTVGATANAYLVVTFVSTQSGADDVTLVQYNGVTMTQLQKVTDAGNARWTYGLFIASPDGASHNLVITYGGGNDNSSGTIASWNGVKQTGLDATNFNTHTGTSTTQSITSVADNCWAVLCAVNIDSGFTVGTGSNLVAGSSQIIADSNGVIHPAGSYSMQLTCSSGARTQMWTQFTLAPIASANGNFLAFM